jgi:exonuclease III
MRIATWNLERPKLNGWSRNPHIIDKIKEVNADLWILTETNVAISPGDNYFSAATLPVPNYHSLGESFTSIWTKWRMLRLIPTFDAEMAICIEVESPFGPMIVYGTIITYANDPGTKNTSKRWVEHRKSILQHAKNWVRIRREFPQHHFVVGGDFNQSRDGSGWYEDKEAVQLLTDALQQASLICVTDKDMRKEGKLKNRASIDHICISEALVADFSVWEGTTEDNQRMSDHNGVMVELRTI